MTGPYALRFQAQQQAALELLQARKLGVADAGLIEVLEERIRSSIIEVMDATSGAGDSGFVSKIQPAEPILPTPANPSVQLPDSDDSPSLIHAANQLIGRLAAEDCSTSLADAAWRCAVACHGRMLALEVGHRLAAIHHAVAGARLLSALRARDHFLPDWLEHHEEQLCRYGALWISERLLGSDLDHGASDSAALASDGVELLERLDEIHEGRHAWVAQYRSDLEAEVARSAQGPTRVVSPSPSIAMAGNCQFWPLFQYLKRLLPAARLHAGPTVHLATPDEVQAFHRLLPSFDLLVIHRIQAGYRNGIGLDNRSLSSHLSPGSRQVVIPNIHYEGHHPWIGYAHDPEGRLARLEESSPLGPYHDFLAMQGARLGLSAGEILARPLLPGLAAEIQQHHQESLQQLRLREVDCDVDIAWWIDKHYRDMPVAHTINHPTSAPLQALLLRLLHVLQLDEAVDTATLDAEEFLGELSIPILPWVRSALSLGEWAESWGQRGGGESFPIESQLAASIAFYADNPWIWDQNQTQEKCRWAASALA